MGSEWSDHKGIQSFLHKKTLSGERKPSRNLRGTIQFSGKQRKLVLSLLTFYVLTVLFKFQAPCISARETLRCWLALLGSLGCWNNALRTISFLEDACMSVVTGHAGKGIRLRYASAAPTNRFLGNPTGQELCRRRLVEASEAALRHQITKTGVFNTEAPHTLMREWRYAHEVRKAI